MIKLFKQLASLIFKAQPKPIEEDLPKNNAQDKIDKVSNFNKIAPLIFGPRLKQFGYELETITNSEHNGSLWSTHHIYQNKNLDLMVDIQQAPYYTDYGFSIFITSSKQQESLLLSNVPHELQDKEDNFLYGISDKFFTNLDMVSLLKGETWKAGNQICMDR